MNSAPNRSTERSRPRGHSAGTQASAILGSLVAIVVIVLGCRWLWESVGAGVFVVLALAVPLSLPALSETLAEAMGSGDGIGPTLDKGPRWWARALAQSCGVSRDARDLSRGATSLDTSEGRTRIS